LCQTQCSVWPAANLGGIVVILAVIFPKANWANLIASSLRQRPATAAWTTIQVAIICSLLRDVGKSHDAKWPNEKS